MKAWRVCLAMTLLAGSYFGLFCATLYCKIPVIQVLFFFLALLVGMLALSFAQDDGAARKKE